METVVEGRRAESNVKKDDAKKNLARQYVQR